MNSSTELPQTEHWKSPRQQVWRRFAKNRLAVTSGVLLLIVLAFVLAYPAVAPYGPDQLSDNQFQPPSRTHWLGTDVHGRDELVRLCCGAQISMLVGAVGASVSLIIGVLWGALAGYSGGHLDGAMMRFVDVLYSLPSGAFPAIIRRARSNRQSLAGLPALDLPKLRR